MQGQKHFFAHSQKGQEAAPFELLIAVIIMMFVLFVGLQATDTLNKEKCKGEIDSELEELRTAVQTVATGKGQQAVGFSTPGCFGDKESSTKIVDRDDRQLCSQACGGSSQLCTLLIFTSPSFVSTKCLFISPNTIFPIDDPCSSSAVGAEGDYDIRDLKDQRGIENGNYFLVSKHSFLSSNPIVCAYKKAK